MEGPSKKAPNAIELAKSEETLDRIGELPEALLVQIPSLLEAQDAVKSSVLSKRWRYLWSSIYNFHFNDRNYNHVENFVSFLDHVLTHSTCSNINKFQLDIHNREWDIDSKISQWFSFAVDKKVEHVVLDDYPSIEEPTYELPLSMYSCSSLITLYLSYVVFDKGLSIAWNSLKSLTLASPELEDDDIVRLLSGCPALETMKLSFCVGCHRLDMASSNLKTLNLHSHYHLPLAGYGSLEIFAPHLQHLHISGELLRLKCRLVNVSSLVTASLIFTISCITDSWDEDNIKEDSCRDYHQVFRNLVLDYLQKLSSVTELIIGTWLAEICFYVKRPYSLLDF